MKVRPSVPASSFFCAASCAAAKVQTASTVPMTRCFSDIFPPAFRSLPANFGQRELALFSRLPIPHYECVGSSFTDFTLALIKRLYRPQHGVAIVMRYPTFIFFIPDEIG